MLIFTSHLYLYMGHYNVLLSTTHLDDLLYQFHKLHCYDTQWWRLTLIFALDVTSLSLITLRGMTLDEEKTEIQDDMYFQNMSWPSNLYQICRYWVPPCQSAFKKWRVCNILFLKKINIATYHIVNDRFFFIHKWKDRGNSWKRKTIVIIWS